jgi:hypothetical protein
MRDERASTRRDAASVPARLSSLRPRAPNPPNLMRGIAGLSTPLDTGGSPAIARADRVRLVPMRIARRHTANHSVVVRLATRWAVGRSR